MSRLYERGQSGVDFLLGFGVFFVTLSFVVTAVPELLSPFTSPEGAIVADRAIETLSSDLLATGTVGTLDEGCTVAFLAGVDRDSCSFDGGNAMSSLVGVSASHGLNVTLHNSGRSGAEIVCYDGDEVRDCDDRNQLAARGDPPPTGTTTVHTVRRVVRIDGQTLWLKLRVW